MKRPFVSSQLVKVCDELLSDDVEFDFDRCKFDFDDLKNDFDRCKFDFYDLKNVESAKNNARKYVLLLV